MHLPRTAEIAARLLVLTECGSTNAELRRRAADPRSWPHLSVLLTDAQTAGRGRLTRQWTTPPGTALAVSVLLRELPAETEAFGWIPLAAGVAMADAVAAQLPGHEVGVKWPNDVLVDGGKICGILAEATAGAVVLGAGVNTAMVAAQLPVPTATSFAVLGVHVDADRLVSGYLARLDRMLQSLAAGGDAMRSGLHAAVERRCLSLGRDVEVVLPDGSRFRARAVRLGADGRLVVHDGEGERAISAADIVHARLQP